MVDSPWPDYVFASDHEQINFSLWTIEKSPWSIVDSP